MSVLAILLLAVCVTAENANFLALIARPGAQNALSAYMMLGVSVAMVVLAPFLSPAGSVLPPFPLVVLLVVLESGTFVAARRAWRLNAGSPGAVGVGSFATLALIPLLASAVDHVPALAGGPPSGLSDPLRLAAFTVAIALGVGVYAARRAAPAHVASIAWMAVAMSATLVVSVRLMQTADSYRLYAIVEAALAVLFAVMATIGGEWRHFGRRDAHRAAIMAATAAGGVAVAILAARLLPVEFLAVFKRCLQAAAGLILEARHRRPRVRDILAVAWLAVIAVAFRML